MTPKKKSFLKEISSVTVKLSLKLLAPQYPFVLPSKFNGKRPKGYLVIVGTYLENK